VEWSGVNTLEAYDLSVLNDGSATHQADQEPYRTAAIDLTIADTQSAAEARWMDGFNL